MGRQRGPLGLAALRWCAVKRDCHLPAPDLRLWCGLDGVPGKPPPPPHPPPLQLEAACAVLHPRPLPTPQPPSPPTPTPLQLEAARVPIKQIKHNPQKVQPVGPALQSLLSKDAELKARRAWGGARGGLRVWRWGWGCGGSMCLCVWRWGWPRAQLSRSGAAAAAGSPRLAHAGSTLLLGCGVVGRAQDLGPETRTP